MKHGIHPDYGPVVVRDQTSGETFLTRSTVVGTRRLPTITWTDGVEYPVLDVELSSSSHPVWTGTARPVERGGQVEKFRRRYGTRSIEGSTPIGELDRRDGGRRR